MAGRGHRGYSLLHSTTATAQTALMTGHPGADLGVVGAWGREMKFILGFGV